MRPACEIRTRKRARRPRSDWASWPSSTARRASQRLQDALAQIGQQLAAEKDAELQTLLSAAFVRLSQEAASRRYYRAMQQALDSLADLEELRPSWAQSLRPRIGVENRVPEFIEEALAAEAMPEGLVGRADARPAERGRASGGAAGAFGAAHASARTSCSWPRRWAARARDI